RRRRRSGRVADREADPRGLLHEDPSGVAAAEGHARGQAPAQSRRAGAKAMRALGLQLPRATVGMSRWRRFRAAVDWPLIVTILALCTIGLLNLYSATRGVK